MLFLIIMHKSKLIHLIFCLQKKTLTFHTVIMHIKSIWNKDQGHYYFNIFLINIRINYLKITINYKCYVMIKLTVMRGLILIKQVHQKSVIIATFGIF